jgi:vacuolar protein-sorting-associated protein 4
MAATNIPWSLDSAILWRFDKKIYISLPEPNAREYLVWNKLKGLSDELWDSDFKLIA